MDAPATQTCPACGAQNAAINRFCIKCGRSLEAQAVAPPPAVEAIPQNARKVCAGCRTVNQPDSAYCYRCGLKLPDRLYAQAEVIGNPAGFWIRLAAFLMDNVVVDIATVLITALLTDISIEHAALELVGVEEGWTTTIISNILLMAYWTFTTAQWGQTVGKAILGLKVTRTDGSRLSYGRSFARYWAYVVSALPFALGFIAIALSSQKRGWHDFLCDTRVVNVRG